MTIDKENEEEFDDWMDSITFVDKDGKTIEPELTEDKSLDPEGDRA